MDGVNLIVICADTCRVYFTGNSPSPFGERCTLKDVGPGHLGWEPIPNDLTTLAELLREKGYQTALVTDVFHMFRFNMNYHRGFDHWHFFRGQESDFWETAPKGAVNPRDHIQEHLYCDYYERKMTPYLSNTRHWQSEEDYFCPKVYRCCR